MFSARALNALALIAVVSAGASAGMLSARALTPSASRATYAKMALVRSVGSEARYLRLRYDLRFSGVTGTEVGLYDLQSTRYIEHIDAGVLSSSSGFDGTHFWGADSTGLALVEDRGSDVAGDAAFADLFGEKKTLAPRISLLGSTTLVRRFRLEYPSVLGPIDVSVDRKSGSIGEIIARDRLEPERSVYGSYRRVDGLQLPFVQVTTSRLDTTIERVRSVEPLASAPPDAFTMPADPPDVTLDAPTTVPLILRDGSPYVQISIDGAAPLYLMFDSGGSNSLSPRAARILGLHPIGTYQTGGVGAGLERTRRALAKRVRIGNARLADQPFDIEQQTGSDDGTIGCEFMERFVVRIDYRAKTLTFARNAAGLRLPKTSIPVSSDGCEPEIAGEFDGYHGAFGLDTGSYSALDVMGPIVRQQHLIARYHAVAGPDGGGYGGEVRAALSVAKHVRLGGFDLRDVPIHLSAMSQGAFADPSEIGNVGASILDRFVVTIDLPHRRMWLEENLESPQPMR